MKHRHRAVVLVTAIACAAAAATAQQTRDNAAPVSASGSIAGTVLVDVAERQPARRVRVTLTDLARTAPGQTTTTDDNGAFVFRNVPAGRFEVQAFKNGYLRASYGASRPDRTGTPVVVTDGAAVRDLTIRIARGGVIAGSVRDARGRALPGMTVRVLKLGYSAGTGEPTLGVPDTSTVSPTDDRGEYRAYGLPPGGYMVLVDPQLSGRAGGSGDDIRALSSADVQRALQTARAGGASPNAAGAETSTASAVSSRVNYAPVFHPNVTDIAAAARITLGLGEERAGVDVTMQFVPTATISGAIGSTTGAVPTLLAVRIVPTGAFAEMLAGAGLRGFSTVPGAGRYQVGSVPPGSYTVKASTGYARGAPPNGPTVSASVDINVSGHDLDVPLTLQPGVPISGRVAFEGAQPSAEQLQSLTIRLLPPGTGGALLPGGGGNVGADGRFTFASVPPDVYFFIYSWNAPGAGEKWTIKSATANGNDAFETPLRVNANQPVEWTITFTDKPSQLTGTLQERSGRAATDYYILVCSADRSRWTPGSRRVRMTRPATDGSFSIKGLPPGDYIVGALTDLETGEWNDPALLDQLSKAGVKVTLRDGETTRQDLSIGK